MASEIIQIVTTFASKTEALALCDILLQARLAACVQIDGPIESRYWWNGSIASETEYRCTIKTMEQTAKQCIAAIQANHPYKVAEILVTSVQWSADEYSAWVGQQVKVEPPAN